MRKLSYMAVALLAFGVVGYAAEKAKETNLLKATNVADNWRLEQHEGAKAKLSVDGDAIVFEATETTTEAWHVQAN
ncbi:MAG: hypothetical protein ACAI43_21895 [Phycisphaerae bacterium]